MKLIDTTSRKEGQSGIAQLEGAAHINKPILAGVYDSGSNIEVGHIKNMMWHDIAHWQASMETCHVTG